MRILCGTGFWTDICQQSTNLVIYVMLYKIMQFFILSRRNIYIYIDIYEYYLLNRWITVFNSDDNIYIYIFIHLQ